MHISDQSLQHPDSCRSAVCARWEEGRQVRWKMRAADGLPRALGDAPMGLARMDAFSRQMGDGIDGQLRDGPMAFCAAA